MFAATSVSSDYPAAAASSSELLFPRDANVAFDDMMQCLPPSPCISAPFSPVPLTPSTSNGLPPFSFSLTSALALAHSNHHTHPSPFTGRNTEQSAPHDSRLSPTALISIPLAAAPQAAISVRAGGQTETSVVASGVSGRGSGGSARRRASRLISCSFCHTNKQKCSADLPCERCVRLNRAHLCVKWRDPSEAGVTNQQQQQQQPRSQSTMTHSTYQTTEPQASEDSERPANNPQRSTSTMPDIPIAGKSVAGHFNVDNAAANHYNNNNNDNNNSNIANHRVKRVRSPTLSESSSESTASSSSSQLPSSPPRRTSATADEAPTDVFALLIREHPCSRDYLCVAEHSASPSDYLSRAMVRGALRTLAGGGLVMSPVAQLLARTRIHAMVHGDDAETMVHNHNLRYHVLELRRREKHRQSQKAARGEDGGDAVDWAHAVSEVSDSVQADNRMMMWSKSTFVPAGSYRRDPTTGACDGSVCGGLCIAAKAHIARDPWQLSFTESPTTALSDQPYNNHPLLLLQRHHSTTDNHNLFVDRLHKHVTGHNCPPLAAPLTLAWSVRVNHAFERLFGYSQRQLRSMFIEHQWLASFLLLDRSEWERIVVEDMVAEFGSSGSGGVGCGGGDRGWEGQVRCVDRWGRQFECLLVKSFEMDDQQLCNAIHINFIAKRNISTPH